MSNIYQALGSVVEKASQHFVNETSASIAQAIYPFVAGALLCWLMVMAYQMMAGKLQEPAITLAERSLAVVFLSAIAFGPSVYQVDILNSFDELQNALVSAVAGKSTTPYEAADVALQRGFDLAGKFSEETSVSGPESFFGWAIGSLLIYASVAVLTLMAGGSIIVAKASLALVLAFGQACIACAMFPMTRKIFDAFMSSVLNRILTVAIISAVMGLALDIFTGVSGGYNADDTDPLTFSFEVLIAVIVCVWLIKGAGTIASELAGGVATAVANPITRAAQLATQPVASAGNYLGGKVSRTNASTGEKEYASRLSHIVRGNTVANPAYRQKAMANIRNGWGPASGGSAKNDSADKSPAEKQKAMAKRREK